MPLPKPPHYKESISNKESTEYNTNPAHTHTREEKQDTSNPFQVIPKKDQKKDTSKDRTKTPTEPKDRHNKKAHHIARHELKEILGKLTPKQTHYIMARLIDPSWPFTACSDIANSKTSPTQMERQTHVARILKAAKANRKGLDNLSQGDISSNGKLSREDALSILSIIATDEDSNNKDIMEAIKQCRDLEDWDKGNKTVIGALASVLAALPVTAMLGQSLPKIEQSSPITLPNLTQEG